MEISPPYEFVTVAKSTEGSAAFAFTAGVEATVEAVLLSSLVFRARLDSTSLGRTILSNHSSMSGSEIVLKDKPLSGTPEEDVKESDGEGENEAARGFTGRGTTFDGFGPLPGTTNEIDGRFPMEFAATRKSG